eukprot:2322395-Pyramimonas_sp.AAC.1
MGCQGQSRRINRPMTVGTTSNSSNTFLRASDEWTSSADTSRAAPRRGARIFFVNDRHLGDEGHSLAAEGPRGSPELTEITPANTPRKHSRGDFFCAGL